MSTYGHDCTCEFWPVARTDDGCPEHGSSFAAIKARAAAAIPGPWMPDYDSCDCGDGYGCGHGGWVHAIEVPEPLRQPARGQEPSSYDYRASEISDFPMSTGRFLAHSRADVEWLIGEVERLRGLVGEES